MVALPQVKCTVSNCVFWKNDYCNASTIEVAVQGVDTLPYGKGDMEAGTEPGTTATAGTRRHARNTNDTCCVTFRPKDAGREATYEPGGREGKG